MNQTNVMQIVLRANQLADKGLLNEAIVLYTEAIVNAPNEFIIFHNRGSAYNDKGEYDKALDDYNYTIRLNPKHANAYVNRGYIYYRQKKDYQAAISNFSICLEISPQHFSAFYGRGLAYHALGQFPQANLDWKQAKMLNPKIEVFSVNMGDTYLNECNYVMASQQYTDAMRLNPENPFLYTNRALCFRMQHLFDKAISDYKQALYIDLGLFSVGSKYAHAFAMAYIERGDLYLSKQDYDKAIEDYSRAVRTEFEVKKVADLRLINAYKEKGYSFQVKKEYDTAITLYNQAIGINPQENTLYLYRGQCYADKDDHIQAIKDYDEAIRLNPQYTEAYDYRGRSYVYSRAYNRALADFEKAIQLDLTSKSARKGREWVLNKLKA